MCSFIEFGEQRIEVVDAPDEVIHFFEADVFVCERLRKRVFIAAEFEFSRAAHTADFKVSWIFGFGQTRRHVSSGILIERCRHSAADPPVRSVIIEVFDKVVESMLLGRVIALRRTCGCGL